MEYPIFPNGSYFLALGGSDQRRQHLQKALEIHGSRIFFCKDSVDLERTSQVMRWISGLFIFADGIPESELTRALDYSLENAIVTRVISGAIKEEFLEHALVEPLLPNSGYDSVKAIVDRYVEEMLPSGLNQILLESVQSILPNVIPGLKDFATSTASEIPFSRQINFSMVAGDIIGYSATQFDLQKIALLVPENRKLKVLGDVQEAVNQCLGLIMQCLAKVDVHVKQGLPTVFDITRIPRIQNMVFFPSAYVMDSQKTLQISLGFIDLSDTPLFDLTGIKPGSGSDDIEFL